MSVSINTAIQATQSVTGHRPLMDIVFKALFLRGLGPISAFLLTIILARMLGAEATGAFYLTMTVMTFCAILAKFGLETTLLRFAGSAVERGDWIIVMATYRQARKMSLGLSILLAGLMLIFSGQLANILFEDSYHSLIILAGFSLIPFTWFGIQSAMLKAIGQAAWGGFFEVAALPMITIVLIALSSYFVSLSIFSVAVCYLSAAFITALLASSLLHQRLPDSQADFNATPRGLFTSCLPLTMVELINYALLWAPLLILGVLADETSAGQFNVSNRLAAQLSLLLLVLASITAPRFAAYYQSGKQEQLTQLAGRSTRFMTLLGLVPAMILLFAAEPILALFGPEFIEASTVLQVLVLGQLINIITGPGGYLLTMTGNEHALRNLLILSLSLLLILAVLLIPSYGSLGAAWATTISLIFQNIACAFLVHQRLGLPFILLIANSRNRSEL